MKQDKNISGQAENEANEKELTQKELEKVSGGLKMAPAALDPDLFQTDPLTGEFGGRGGMGGEIPRKGGISGEFGGRGGIGGDLASDLGGRVGGTGDF
jgi:bacteriocin-like protein